MKKLLCLSAIALAFTIQGAAFAREASQQPDGDDIVETFCDQYSNTSMNSDKVAEQIKLFIAELDNPTLEQLSALLDISEEMEDGESLSEACD